MDPFDAAAKAHRDAVAAFAATATQLTPDAWNAAPAPDKWSPAQVAEHLRLTYTIVRAELEGRGGFRIRTSWWQQRLFQWFYLPRILARARFPRGVPAVREIRPGPGPYDRTRMLEDLASESEVFLTQVRGIIGSNRLVSHPFLGRLDPMSGLQLVTQHMRHHHAQLPGGPAVG